MSRTDDTSTPHGPLSAQEAVEVLAHHLSHISRRIAVSDPLEPIESIGHAFGMRVVRAEEDVVGAHEGAEALEIIPLKGIDPDVS